MKSSGKPSKLAPKFGLLICLLAVTVIITRTRKVSAKSDLSSASSSSSLSPFNNQLQQVVPRATSTGAQLFHNDTNYSRDQQQAATTKPNQLVYPKFVMAQNYLDEHRTHMDRVLNVDSSIDERLANLIYLIYDRGVFNMNFFQFNSADQRQDARNERLLAGPKVNDQLCGQHLMKMANLLDQMHDILHKKSPVSTLDERHLRLARALESFGHYESGYLSGKTHSFGSYNQCLNNKLDLDDTHLVKTRFCWAKLNLDQFLHQEFKPNDKKYSLTTAICLPETCHTRSFKLYKKKIQKLVESQFQLPQSLYIKQTLDVESIFCTADEESQIKIPPSGRLLLVLLAGWLLAAIMATVWRRQVREMRPVSLIKQTLTCLNLKRSWQDFVGVTSSVTSGQVEKAPPTPTPTQRRVDLNTLNPVRCAGCAFVVWGHALLIRLAYAMEQAHLPSLMEGEPFGGFVVVGTVVVDTFFAISGMITCYMTMKKARKASDGQSNEQHRRQSGPNSTRFFSSLYLLVKTRYLRLFPMLILFYWFKRSVFIYLGSGPFWDFGFNRETYNGACHQESWLVPFTFTSAFLPLSKQCLAQSWSVSNDMFFAVIFAPIMLVVTRKPKLAVSLAVVYCVASLQALLNAFKGLSPGERMPIEDLTAQGFGSMFSHVSHIYSYPIYRVTSYAIGMMAGYFLHHYNESNIKQWPGWFSGPATTFSLTYIAGVFLILSNGGLIKPLVDPHHRIVFPYFVTLGKVVWAATNCVVFLRMTTDWNQNFWMQASASKFWQSMSKINYAILLLHFDLLIFDASATPQGTVNNMWTIFQAFSTVYLISHLLGAFVYVVFEDPLDRLVKKLMLPKKNPVDTNKCD